MFCTALALAVPVRDSVDPQKSLQDQLQGRWQLVSALRAGQPEGAEKNAGTFLTCKGNVFLLREPGRNEDDEATFKLDLSSKPVAIDIWPKGASGKEPFMRGIVKVEGNLLTICFADFGQPRPSAFTSPAKSTHLLAQLRRLK
jgi:uncharacterized protein (TIGR03067 family)